MTEKTLIDTTDIPCQKDPNYRFKDCILTWVANDAGCHLDWFSAPPGNITNICRKRDDIKKYSDALVTALQARWIQLQSMTGCIPKCTVRSYEFVEKSRTEVNWKRTWSASFYLDVKTS